MRVYQRVIARLLVATLALPTVMLAPSVAAAADKAACVAASDSAQGLRSAMKLREARKQLLVCVQDDCPAVVKKDCGDWLAEVDKAIPTVVFHVTDATGGDVSAVKVLVDGAVLVDTIDGSAVAIDPGAHTIRYEGPGGEVFETKVVIREAEKNRVLAVSFGKAKGGDVTPPPPPASAGDHPTPHTSGVPSSTIILGGFGVLGIAGFAYFGLTGINDRNRLRDRCAPYCDKSEESPARTKLAIADVSLLVGVVSLGLATYFYLARPVSKDAAPVATTGSFSVDLAPLAGGGIAFAGGHF